MITMNRSILLWALPVLFQTLTLAAQSSEAQRPVQPPVFDLISQIQTYCPNLRSDSGVQSVVYGTLICSHRLENAQLAPLYTLLHQLIRDHYPLVHSEIWFPQSLRTVFQRLQQICPPGSLSVHFLAFAHHLNFDLNVFPILHAVGCEPAALLEIADEKSRFWNGSGGWTTLPAHFLGFNREEIDNIMKVMLDASDTERSCEGISPAISQHAFLLPFFVGVYSAFPGNAKALAMLTDYVSRSTGEKAEACLGRLAQAVGHDVFSG